MSERTYIGLHCDDCSVGTVPIGEYYMVKAEIWEQAWPGRGKSWHAVPGHEILCIGCLEQRLGRKLTRTDFTDAPINDPSDRLSSRRLRQRLRDARSAS